MRGRRGRGHDRAGALLAVLGVQHEEHDPERRAERDEHRHAGPLGPVAERLGEQRRTATPVTTQPIAMMIALA